MSDKREDRAEWDDPIASLPPLARVALGRLLALGADTPGLLSELGRDAAEAEQHGDRADAAALNALAALFADYRAAPDFVTVLKVLRTAVERADLRDDA